MTKPFDFAKILEEIDSSQISYQEFMNNYRGFIRRNSKRFTPDERAGIEASMRNALRKSLTELPEKELRREYTISHHMNLFRAAEALYSRVNGKPSWQIAIEDAGKIDPSRKNSKWSIARIVKKFDLFIPEEIVFEHLKKGNSDFCAACWRKVGGLGKAAIISGFDYIKEGKSNHPEIKYEFRSDETVKLATNSSLDNRSRARVIFNILALQYYTPDSGFSINLEEQPAGYRCCQQHIHFNHGLETRLEQGRQDRLKMRVLLTLNPGIQNPYHQAGMYFQGLESIDTAASKYNSLVDLIAEVKRKAS